MNYISFLFALVVISGLIYLLLKQKTKHVAGHKVSRRRRNIFAKSSHQQHQSESSINTELVESKWRDISHMQNGGASGLRSALIEADKLLDYVMIQKGFSGETMGDRLKSGGAAFSNLNAVWGAHKLRNQIAHEVEHDIVASQVQNAIVALGNGIKDLGVRL